MGCKADLAANSTAIGKKFNAADRPSLTCHRPQGVMQSILKCYVIYSKLFIKNLGTWHFFL